MESSEELCITCAANGFFLAKKTKNKEDVFIRALSNSLLVHPDDTKRIFNKVKRKWNKKKTKKTVKKK